MKVVTLIHTTLNTIVGETLDALTVANSIMYNVTVDLTTKFCVPYANV